MATDKSRNRKPANQGVNTTARARRAEKSARKAAGEYNSLWRVEKQKRENSNSNLFGVKVPKQKKSYDAQIGYTQQQVQAVLDSGLQFEYSDADCNWKHYNITNSEIYRPRVLSAQQAYDILVSFNEREHANPDMLPYGKRCIAMVDSQPYARQSCLLRALKKNPDDHLDFPEIMLCAFKWGVERVVFDVNKVACGLYVQDSQGESAFVSWDSFNRSMNFISKAEASQVRDIRRKHDLDYVQQLEQFGEVDYTLCEYDVFVTISQCDGNLIFDQKCAFSIKEVLTFDPDQNTTEIHLREGERPYVAYMRKTIKPDNPEAPSVVVRDAYVAVPGYHLVEIQSDKNQILVEDSTGYKFVVRWMTWHNAFNYLTFKDWIRSRNESQESHDIKADVTVNADGEEVFSVEGVTPLK